MSSFKGKKMKSNLNNKTVVCAPRCFSYVLPGSDYQMEDLTPNLNHFRGLYPAGVSNFRVISKSQHFNEFQQHAEAGAAIIRWLEGVWNSKPDIGMVGFGPTVAIRDDIYCNVCGYN